MCIHPRVDYFTWKCPGNYCSFESYCTLLKYRAASSSSLLTTKIQSAEQAETANTWAKQITKNCFAIFLNVLRVKQTLFPC